MRVKKVVRLINNERSNRKVVSVKAVGCTGVSTDICTALFDYAICIENSYDVCGKDYAGCFNNSYDYCVGYDTTACGTQIRDIT